jgi:hypothetical protein
VNGRSSHFTTRAVIPAQGVIASRAEKGDHKENGFSIASIVVRKRDEISDERGDRFQRPENDLF